MMKALQAGRPEPVQLVPNIGDGLNASVVGENAFATIKGKLDRMVIYGYIVISRSCVCFRAISVQFMMIDHFAAVKQNKVGT